jgi:hypothetical protein
MKKLSTTFSAVERTRSEFYSDEKEHQPLCAREDAHLARDYGCQAVHEVHWNAAL